MAELEVIHHCDQLVVINKPAGLLTHRTALDRRENRDALRILRDQIGAWLYPVHRLDKPTSGVLVFALSSEAAARCAHAMTLGNCQKTYLAVVRGFAPSVIEVDHPVRDRDARGKPAREARTRFETLHKVTWPWPVDRYPEARYSLVRCQPFTGRRHQIRKHLKHIAHPIIGDVNYGKGTHNRLFQERLGVSRLLLHAARLQLSAGGVNYRFSAPLDDAWHKVLHAAQWSMTDANDNHPR